nr:putative capsid protein [Crucivirus sp.]
MPRVAAAKPKKKKAAPRAKASVRGHGDYGISPSMRYGSTYSNPGPVGKAGRYLGGLAGKAVAGPVGQFLGEHVGGLAHYIGKIFGSGDYVASAGVKVNSIVNPSYQPQALAFNSGKTQVRIRHREFLGDVLSASVANTFQIKSYSLNPGLGTTFPWLAQVCGATFQQYRINGMVFEFRSMSADALNSTNTALGSVIMATDYDSADAAFNSKQQMENTEFGVSCKPSSNMIHAIECARSATSITEQYIRAFANPPNTDIRVYDLGKFYIATSGFQGTNVNCGELWVSYDITLIKAIEQPPGYIIPASLYTITNGGTVNLNAHPFGNSPADVGRNVGVDQIGLTVSGTTIKFPSDMMVGSQFNVSYYCAGAATACTLGTIVGTNGLDCSVQYLPANDTLTKVIWSIGAIYRGGGTVASPPTLTFQGTTLPANVTYAEVAITQMGYAQTGP